MAPTTPPPNTLGDFLKARRASLSPAAVGLPEIDGARRVDGLRREEVALLASISTDYYTRIEQGRRRASAPVLNVLAVALRLTDEERAHLHELAGREETGSGGGRASQTAQPQLRRILDGLTTLPALVMGRRMDILAWNPLGAALLSDFSRLPEGRRNYAWLMFRDPAMRALHQDFENIGAVCVAMLRREAGIRPEDQRLADLVAELRGTDEDFDRWWGEHKVASDNGGSKRLRHAVVGDLTLDWDALTCAHDPTQRLVVWTAEPGTPSHDRLATLASLTADAMVG
ncbi:helix-turn-helix transcriptional regulator [Streptomyces sp. NPDC006458]|uniref:helix-turn-helix domain-containing protein n=1 Tax=Streptomyces sp. NPDC006458 TaxID=3154302 RepID=UPI0033B82071